MAERDNSPAVLVWTVLGGLACAAIVFAMLSLGESRTGPLDDEDLLQLEMKADAKAEGDAAWKSRAGELRANHAALRHALGANYEETPISPKKAKPFTLESRDTIKEFHDILEGQRRDTVQLPAIPESPPPIHVELVEPQAAPTDPPIRLLNNRD